MRGLRKPLEAEADAEEDEEAGLGRVVEVFTGVGFSAGRAVCGAPSSGSGVTLRLDCKLGGYAMSS